MHYDIINDCHLGVLTAPVPSTATQYLGYKVRLHLSDQTFGDTEWRTLLNITANEGIQLPKNNNNNAQSMTIFKLIRVNVFFLLHNITFEYVV